jgi:hypothetical protein
VAVIAEILIKPQTVCCPAHGEHLRAAWPAGFATVSMTLFQAALEADELKRLIDPGWDGEGKVNMDEARLNAVLAERPLCYFVGRETILKALRASGIGKYGRCDVCGVPRLGGPYSVTQPTGREEWTLCFECALDGGERLHAEHPDGGVWT